MLLTKALNYKGKVIGILNSDDIYYPGTLKLVYNYFSKKY